MTLHAPPFYFFTCCFSYMEDSLLWFIHWLHSWCTGARYTRVYKNVKAQCTAYNNLSLSLKKITKINHVRSFSVFYVKLQTIRTWPFYITPPFDFIIPLILSARSQSRAHLTLAIFSHNFLQKYSVCQIVRLHSLPRVTPQIFITFFSLSQVLKGEISFFFIFSLSRLPPLW